MAEDPCKTVAKDTKQEENTKMQQECPNVQETPEKKKPLGLERCFSPRKEKPPVFIAPASTMKQEYQHPSVHGAERKDIAKRRALFRSQVIAEMIEEIKRESETKDPVEDYCTTYDDMFHVEGFKADDKPKFNEELHLKYPLYKCQPITYYSRIVEKEPKDKPSLPGMTRIRNLENPFTKNQAFTTPIGLRMEDPSVYGE